MNWTALLAAAGIPESPGRAEVVAAAHARTAALKAKQAAEVAAKQKPRK